MRHYLVFTILLFLTPKGTNGVQGTKITFFLFMDYSSCLIAHIAVLAEDNAGSTYLSWNEGNNLQNDIANFGRFEERVFYVDTRNLSAQMKEWMNENGYDCEKHQEPKAKYDFLFNNCLHITNCFLTHFFDFSVPGYIFLPKTFFWYLGEEFGKNI